MLNTYMIYSRGIGPEEGAALVFAHSVQEARKVGWHGIGSDLTDDYLDLTAKRLRNMDWIREEADATKLNNDIPHVIDSPKTCLRCQLWGVSPLDKDGYCENCQEDMP